MLVRCSINVLSYRLTAVDQEPCASTLNSHLVHSAIIEAGKKWSSASDVNELAKGGIEAQSEEEDMMQPIGPRGEDIGLRCLRVQGKFDHGNV